MLASELISALESAQMVSGETITGPLQQLSLSGVVFNNVDFRQATWIASELNQVVFTQCNLSGIDFTDVSINGLTLNNCSAQGCNFSARGLQRLVGTKTDFTGTTFAASTINRGTFFNCVTAERA